MQHTHRERWLLGGWAGVCVGTGAAWAVARCVDALGWELSWPAAWAAGAVIGIVAAALAARRVPSLRWRVGWRSGAWTLAEAGQADDAGQPGQLQSMIDLGAWMLVRFRPDAPRRGSRWFVVGAGESASGRHALRAALYWPGQSLDLVRTRR
ncbi:MAG: hypothetical protein U1E89_11350 [Burkholderiaceae bacterium]